MAFKIIRITVARWAPCLVLALASFAPAAASAQDAPVPAVGNRFSAAELRNATHAGFDPRAFDGVADYRGDRDFPALLVNCVAHAPAGGTGPRRTRTPYAESIQCFRADPAQDSRFATEVERAATRGDIREAEVAGDIVSTEIYFRVMLDREGGRPQVRYMPNWGYDADSYGLDYAAPQRILGQERRANDQAFTFNCGAARFMTIVTVGADGRPMGAVEFDPIEGDLTLDCEAAISALLGDATFLPAQSNGMPVAARHVEIWGAGRRFRAEFFRY
ncbi:MAG: hypothetical protein R3315_03355 [Woeseiaceae bacterium]|nr:hypothetical protein [Woeseiaceae bacterium]